MSSLVVTNSKWRAAAESTALFLLSAVIAVAGTAALASVANVYNWCCVHSWALAHGTGLIVLLMFGLVGFHLISAVGLRTRLLRPFDQFGVLPHVAYLGGALGSLFFTGHFMWVGLIAGAAAIFFRLCGRKVQPFGLALLGFIVSLLSAAYWVYLKWAFSSYGLGGG